MIHNFLSIEDANALLKELLEESKSFGKITFKLFENMISTPHTSVFYVDNYEEIQDQKTEYYLYNGTVLSGVRRHTPNLAKVETHR